MSLLTIIQAACARLSLTAPTTVAANTDQQVKQLLQAAQEEGKNLARHCAWKALQREKTFSTTAAAIQTGAIPTDFNWMLPETIFNRTQRRAVEGPVDPKDWQLLQASLVGRVFLAYRIRGTDMLITPTPTAGETVAYEYVTKNWCTTSDGVTGQALWTADNDLPILSDELHIQGVVWRFLKMRGMDYADYLRDYQGNVMNAMIREGTRPRIDTSNSRRDLSAGDIIQGGYRVVAS